MIFGKQLGKGIVLDGQTLKVVVIDEDGVTKDDLLIHDEQADLSVHFRIARMLHPEFPEAIGVLRSVERETYDDSVNNQVQEIQKTKGKGDLQKLLSGRATWEVKE